MAPPPTKARGLRGAEARHRTRSHALAAAALCAVVLALSVSGSRAAAEPESPPTVLVLFGSFNGFSPYDQFYDRLVESIKRDYTGHVDVHAEFVDSMVSRGAEYEAALGEYLRHKYAGNRVEVVVGVGARAAQVALKLRDEVFPTASVVYGYVGHYVASTIDFGGNATGVTGDVNIAGTVALAVRLLPQTERVAMVIGASDTERQWYEYAATEARSAGVGAEFVPLFGLTHDEMLRRLAELPDRTVVVWGAFFRDATGASYDPGEVLGEARAVSRAPLFGLFDYDFGRGIVGGQIVDVGVQGDRTGALVARVLSGESPGTIAPVHVTDNPVWVDWRELRRWGIDAGRLPPGTVVAFREQSAWEQYRWYIVAGAALVAIQSALLLVMLAQRSRRKRDRSVLAEQLRFERLIADLSARFVDLPEAEVAAAIGDGLREIRVLFDADRVNLLEYSHELAHATVSYSVTGDGVEQLPEILDGAEFANMVETVKNGSFVQFSHPDELPDHQAPIRDALVRRGVRSGIAVPLHTAGVTFGSLTVASTRATRTWSEYAATRLTLLADVFANAIGRERAASEIRRSQALSGAVLASLSAQVCVVDRNGEILVANDAWRDAAGTQAGMSVAWLLSGDVESADGAIASADAKRIRTGIRAVLDGELDGVTTEYRAVTPAADRWYQLTVERLRAPEGGAVISNLNVTSRKRAELEAEQRRQELAHVSRVSTLGELAAAIAHELNQPLSGVLANAQAAMRYLAAEPPDLTEVREILHDIVEDDRRAGEVIRRLRSMLQAGAIEPTEIDVNTVVQEVLRLVGSDAMLRNVAVELQLAGGLERVHGDRIQLQQVILNLVVNAMDAMVGLERLERRVTVRTMAPDRDTVLITVSDRGAGIERDKLGRIFQPFYTTKAEGLGMGLSIARSIVEAHGGLLWAVNNADRGASFLCRLPATGDGATASRGATTT